MKPLVVSAIATVVLALYAISGNTTLSKNDPVSIAVEKGAKWLVSTQGKDGGWGQDGGETSYVRQGEKLESSGNDVANTAVAAAALLHSGSTPVKGEYQAALVRAVDFVLQRVDSSPIDSLEHPNCLPNSTVKWAMRARMRMSAKHSRSASRRSRRINSKMESGIWRVDGPPF